MAKTHLKLVKLTSPVAEKRTVTRGRASNKAMGRTREWLTEAEVEALMKAAKGNRWGSRDGLMVLVGYRHGLRVSELVDLQWSQVDFEKGTLAVRRLKKGSDATHPIMGDELRGRLDHKRANMSMGSKT